MKTMHDGKILFFLVVALLVMTSTVLAQETDVTQDIQNIKVALAELQSDLNEQKESIAVLVRNGGGGDSGRLGTLEASVNRNTARIANLMTLTAVQDTKMDRLSEDVSNFISGAPRTEASEGSPIVDSDVVIPKVTNNSMTIDDHELRLKNLADDFSVISKRMDAFMQGTGSDDENLSENQKNLQSEYTKFVLDLMNVTNKNSKLIYRNELVMSNIFNRMMNHSRVIDHMSAEFKSNISSANKIIHENLANINNLLVTSSTNVISFQKNKEKIDRLTRSYLDLNTTAASHYKMMEMHTRHLSDLTTTSVQNKKGVDQISKSTTQNTIDVTNHKHLLADITLKIEHIQTDLFNTSVKVESNVALAGNNADKVSVMTRTVNDINAKVAQLMDCANLPAVVRNHTTEIQYLRDIASQNFVNVGNNQEKISYLTGNVSINIDTLEEILPNIPIGFAGMTVWADKLVSFGTNEDVAFTKQILSSQYFSPVTGHFTCTYPGVYYVTVNFVKNGDSNLQINLMKDDELLIQSALGQGYTSSVLTECEVGQNILIKGKTRGTVNGETEVPWSTFSVMRLPDEDHDVVGFTVVLEADQELSPGDRVMYDTTRYTSDVTVYSSSNKKYFKCEVAGVYFVNVNCQSRAEQSMSIAVYKRGVPPDLDKAFLYSSIRDSLPFSYRTTNNALIHCAANEIIEVKGVTETSILAGDAMPISTHSVFLAMPDVNEDGENNEFYGCSMSKGSEQIYNESHVIGFDIAIYNDGAYYSENEKRFLCPVAGVYYVSLNVKKSGNTPMHVHVLHGSKKLFVLKDSEENSYESAVLSNGLVFEAEAGDTVQVVAGASGAMAGNLNEAHSTFTVFLVQRKYLWKGTHIMN